MTASLSDDEIEDRYFLLGRMEILSVLNDLIHRRQPVTVYFNNGRDFLLTTLLEARSNALIFDLGGDSRLNPLLPESLGCVFVSHLNGIRIQFSGGQAHRFSWGGSDAFWVPLPERIVRLQRRESYRILLPVAKPLMASLYMEDNVALGEWATHDLSVHGLGMLASELPKFEINQKLPRLKLLLHKQRGIDCEAVVHHITQLSERQGSVNYRIGVSFADLSPAMGVTIQRYITKIEHERSKLVNAQLSESG